MTARAPAMYAMSRYFDLTEAQVAKGALRAEGSDSLLRDEFLGSIDWTCIVALGGLRLEANEPELRELIQEPVLALVTAVPELSEYEAPDWVRLRSLKRLAAAVLLVPYLAIPLFPLMLARQRK